ncbi:ABC transporter permease [Polaribacter sejongensis]|uniref:Transport permease protein n=1 Tax=Polaribacter sejongensis TaxID=985043 RepID=A0AAJ1QW37_9FLAO|nr:MULTISPECIES: ABC transporter permease [Polaribacter]AUC22783.1 ABC transporter permease [Polaribacter sejongensis]MDN3618948.1 ABC transporter permease [Polaribacter undariae]UWD33036.1 ABC transporter permease [Polaribacter undariae]
MNKEKWLFEITPKNNLFDLNLKEVWEYRDLLMLFVKRDVVTVYKQTILGPLWYLIQPLFTSIVFTLVFNTIANISTGGIPPFLFNLAGVTSWNYFKECLTGTSDTFKKNQAIFGKVYFPRIIMPMSVVVSNLLKFGIQFGILAAFYVYYVLNGSLIRPNIYFLTYPIVILCMALLGLGLGMIISSMVTKYRDLTFLVSFGVQLLMYVSLVSLPYSLFKENDLTWAVDYNPVAHIIEYSRFVMLGEGTVSQFGVIYTLITSVVVFLLGILVFNKTEKSFIDTI